MGLDIYLSYYSDYKKSKKNEKIFEDLSENLWDEVKAQEGDELCEKTKERVWDVLEAEAEKLGLDKYGCDTTYCTGIREDSKLYPEHGFKIGYFRSSYNSSGINGILNDLNIPDLYDIFETNDQYEFSPNWYNALNVVQESINLLKEDKGYRVETISANMFAPDNVMKNPKQALDVFNQNIFDVKASKREFKWYSNRDGNFYLDNKGLQVHALLPGKDLLGNHCTYAVYKLKDGNKYYLEALEIVKETIEYVLAQENPQAYYLRWSA